MVVLYVAIAVTIGVVALALSSFQRNVARETISHLEAEVGGLATLERSLLSAEEPIGVILYEVGDPLVLEDNWRRFHEVDSDIRSRLAQFSAATHSLDSVAKATEQHWSGIAEEVGAARRLWGTGAVAAGLAGGKDPYADTVWNRLRIIKDTMADGLVAVTADGRKHVREADRRQAIVPPILVAMVLAALGAGLLSGRRLSRRVVSPLSGLREAAGRIRDGDLDRPVDVEPCAAREATELAVAMNDMAAGLSRIQDQLRHQAFHDPLTGLANRALLTDRLNHALVRHQRSGRLFGLVLLDLDDFKSINDSLGHWAGDALLVNIADRLARCTRESDTLARLGGDEFAILLEDLADPKDAVHVAERILEELGGVFSFDGRAFPVSASLGIALAETGGVAVEDLIRDADVAMYITKSNGKGSYTLFEGGMHVAVKERLQLKSDLSQALGTDQLTLHYQPIIDLRSGRISGVEALARWHHPGRGDMVSPAEFIPVAEESGLIVPLGLWVLETACREIQGWRQAGVAEPGLRLSVNVSGRQLEDPDFVGKVQRVIQQTDFDPAMLILEITESVVVSRLDDTVPRLTELKRLGIQLAIDDFGTGYSSLSSLQRLPVDILKIDKSFIDHLESEGENGALARAILGLGQTLQLQTVAEGVERGGQADELQRLDCDMAQGYFYARPTPRADLLALLKGGSSVRRPMAGGTDGLGLSPHSAGVEAERG
ncbi:MAG: EAL domain-containing protein [Actinomycetota bacterium]